MKICDTFTSMFVGAWLVVAAAAVVLAGRGGTVVRMAVVVVVVDVELVLEEVVVEDRGTVVVEVGVGVGCLADLCVVVSGGVVV